MHVPWLSAFIPSKPISVLEIICKHSASTAFSQGHISTCHHHTLTCGLHVLVCFLGRLQHADITAEAADPTKQLWWLDAAEVQVHLCR